MIIVYHQDNKVYAVTGLFDATIIANQEIISKSLFQLAKAYPDELILWCHISQKENLNTEAIADIFHHKKMMVSFSPKNFFSDAIGYIESTPFINVNKHVNYPTWQMSALVGGVHAGVLNAIVGEIEQDLEFNYFLNSMSKLAMPNGLFCYSNPKMLRNTVVNDFSRADIFILFRFVRQHYKSVWLLLLFFNFALYQNKFPVGALFFSLFYKKRRIDSSSLDNVKIISTKNNIQEKTIDIVIPTIGRKKYLLDVLKDLNQQTHLPKNVIIVEQNPDAESQSELDFIDNEKWNFNIKHTFTHQAGACNARNIALSQLESEWIFMADDDIRIEDIFLEKVFEIISETGYEVITLNCLQKNEISVFEKMKQWGTFGSGCSIVRKIAVENISFRMSFEFGYGEDADFGMQLRNKGIDVAYVPRPKILHLKAPVGGFRTKPVLAWRDEYTKPSPTIMLFRILYSTKEQLLGSKTLLFIKFYRKQKSKNPFRYLQTMNAGWKASMKWAKILKEQNV